jgi:hypothetical protein
MLTGFQLCKSSQSVNKGWNVRVLRNNVSSATHYITVRYFDPSAGEKEGSTTQGWVNIIKNAYVL